MPEKPLEEPIVIELPEHGHTVSEEFIMDGAVLDEITIEE